MSDDAVLEEQQREEDVMNEREDVMDEQEEQFIKKNSVEDTQAIERTKEIRESDKNEDADKKITTFLHGKGLSETLIKTLINSGLTNENVRLAEINKLQYSSFQL